MLIVSCLYNILYTITFVVIILIYGVVLCNWEAKALFTDKKRKNYTVSEKVLMTFYKYSVVTVEHNL